MIQSMDHITGIVLCGGRSRRVGRPKELLEFGDQTLIQHILQHISPLFERLIVVGGKPPPGLPRGVEHTPDALPGAGPLGGIYTGLLHAKTPHSFFFACDTPFISHDLVRAMAARAAMGDLVVPVDGPHFQPLFAIYSSRCRDVILEHIRRGSYKISDTFEKFQIIKIGDKLQKQYDPAGLSFININTMDDYHRALALYEQDMHSRDSAAGMA